MVRADVIALVGETPGAHGVFDPPTEVKNEVPCTVRSVGYNEFYAARSAGIEPSVVFVLALAEDYAGEKIVEWNGSRYRVVRTWMQGDGIEITCEPVTNDRELVSLLISPSDYDGVLSSNNQFFGTADLVDPMRGEAANSG